MNRRARTLCSAPCPRQGSGSNCGASPFQALPCPAPGRGPARLPRPCLTLLLPVKGWEQRVPPGPGQFQSGMTGPGGCSSITECVRPQVLLLSCGNCPDTCPRPPVRWGKGEETGLFSAKVCPDCSEFHCLFPEWFSNTQQAVLPNIFWCQYYEMLSTSVIFTAPICDLFKSSTSKWMEKTRNIQKPN